MSDSSTDDEVIPGSTGEGDVKVTDSGASGQSTSTNTSAEPPAESAPAEKKDDNKPKDMMAAVRAALKPGKEQSSGSGEGEDANADPEDPAKAQAKEGEEGEAEELTDEERKSLSVKAQRRFTSLVNQNKELTANNEKQKPLAEGFLAFGDFCRKGNLTTEDVNNTFHLATLCRNDPIAALPKIEEVYFTLRKIAGLELPDDLKEQVRTGQLTEGHALEMSKLRAKDGLTALQRQEATQRAETSRTTEINKHVETVKGDVEKAIATWVTQQKANDPDYSLKESRIMERVKLAVYEAKEKKQYISSVKEAVDMANRIKKEVETELKKILPKRSAIVHVTGNGATNGSKPVPKSYMDAVNQALGH